MLAFFASLFLIGAQDPALLEPFEVQGFNTTITVEIDAPRDVVFEAVNISRIRPLGDIPKD